MPTYINTGYARNKKLTVTKGSYSQTYDLCAAFEANGNSYPAITDNEFALLPEEAWKIRLDDFCQYVYSLEPGLENDIPNLKDGSAEYDTVLCPIKIAGGSDE